MECIWMKFTNTWITIWENMNVCERERDIRLWCQLSCDSFQLSLSLSFCFSLHVTVSITKPNPTQSPDNWFHYWVLSETGTADGLIQFSSFDQRWWWFVAVPDPLSPDATWQLAMNNMNWQPGLKSVSVNSKWMLSGGDTIEMCLFVCGSDPLLLKAERD